MQSDIYLQAVHLTAIYKSKNFKNLNVQQYGTS